MLISVLKTPESNEHKNTAGIWKKITSSYFTKLNLGS
jgi:hypothetical protein